MFGQTNASFDGHVLAVVEGGPEYKLTLQGEASAMAYSIEQVFLDFGKVTLTESKEMEFSIKNTGRVPLQFTVEAASEIGAQLLDIGSTSGRIGAGEFLPGAGYDPPCHPDECDGEACRECRPL